MGNRIVTPEEIKRQFPDITTGETTQSTYSKLHDLYVALRGQLRPPQIVVKFKKLHPDALLPKQGTEESVGYDLHAYLLTAEGRPSKKLIPPHYTFNVPTGIALETPPGYFATVVSRSGLAKLSLSVCNSPGIIDPDYRGEIRVLLHNGGYEYGTIHHEDRIAQLIFFPATYIDVVEAETLSETERGEKGLGSTGGLRGTGT